MPIGPIARDEPPPWKSTARREQEQSMPDATAAPKPRRGIVVFIHVPPLQSSSIVGLDLEARASANHTVKAHCGRWGRDLDGVIHVTIEVTVSTPPGALPVLPKAPARPRRDPPRDVQNPHVRDVASSTSPVPPARRGGRG